MTVYNVITGAFKYLLVIIIPESREEIEEELINGKRVRVRLLKDSTPPRARSEKEEAKIINVTLLLMLFSNVS